MHVSRQHKIAFLALPKNASRSVSKALSKIGMSTEGTGHHNIVPPTPDCKNYRAFCIVRNPFSRTVSKWFEMFKRLQTNDMGFQKRAFRAYVEGLKEGTPGEGWNKFYLSTQGSVIDACQGHFNKEIKVVKLENLKDEWDNLFFRHLVDKLPQRKVGRNSGDYGDWRQYYTHDWVIDKVASVYRADLDRFGYPDRVE